MLNKKLVQSERMINECLQCFQCVRKCVFLQMLDKTPFDLAGVFSSGLTEENAYIPYLCTLCGLCKEVCSLDLDCGSMCLEAREMLVEKGIGPLPAHQAEEKEILRVRSEQFTITISSPSQGSCRQVFFPGCQLSEYSPALVDAAYEWLCEKEPHTGLIVRCCGSRAKALGNKHVFTQMANELFAEVSKLGAEEIIVACPGCYRTIKSYDEKVKVRTIYEIMAGYSPVEAIQKSEHIFAIHDPCAIRTDKSTILAVRTLMQSLGFEIQEFENYGIETTCCGMGGMAAYLCPDIRDTIIHQRLAETKADIVTYCACCREAFAGYRPVLHIFDLMFNLNWQKDKNKPPNSKKQQYENTLSLIALLKEKSKLRDAYT